MTKPQFVVDANVFLRFLLKDIPNQYTRAEKLFREAKSGKIELIVPQIVIFEVAFALEKYYNFGKKEVIDKLQTIIATVYLRIQDSEIFAQALKLYSVSNLSLTDCFLISNVRTTNAVLFSFDKRLQKLIKNKKH